MSPFDRAHATSYWCSVWLHLVSFIRYLMSKNIVTAYGFLLVFCSNCVPKAPFLRYSTCSYTVTPKPGLGVTQGHRNRHISIRHLWFPINVHINHGPISYRFRDKRRYQSKIANFSPPPCILRSAKGVPLRIGYRRSGSKKNDGATGPRKKFDDIFRHLDTITIHQRGGRTNGQTDRHWVTAKTAL